VGTHVDRPMCRPGIRQRRIGHRKCRRPPHSRKPSPPNMFSQRELVMPPGIGGVAYPGAVVCRAAVDVVGSALSRRTVGRTCEIGRLSSLPPLVGAS